MKSHVNPPISGEGPGCNFPSANETPRTSIRGEKVCLTYLPLLYVIGAQQPGDAVTFPVEGVDGGSISMLAVQVG